ncbi:MAG TPA: fibrobacter succinogenes major paralogous domain-containing protein [Bacteroidia bacterium]|nr:fibrobacter succinogenes major paralogous domain-containing protein [Bacteroidia bacterium]
MKTIVILKTGVLVFLFSVLFLLGCKKTSKTELPIETGSVTDRQGNVYQTVKIGNQWWMAENLRVKVYNDSTPILEVKISERDSVWANKTIGAFCAIDSRYGLHYNWLAMRNIKKIAPAGWHVPSDDEWKMLELELGMAGEEADNTSWRGSHLSQKLLPESSVGWPSQVSTVYGTNETGFTALPGGCRVFNGTKGEVSATAYWWTSSEQSQTTGWYRNLSASNASIFRYFVDKNYGLNIRCVKDQ